MGQPAGREAELLQFGDAPPANGDARALRDAIDDLGLDHWDADRMDFFRQRAKDMVRIDHAAISRVAGGLLSLRALDAITIRNLID